MDDIVQILLFSQSAPCQAAFPHYDNLKLCIYPISKVSFLQEEPMKDSIDLLKTQHGIHIKRICLTEEMVLFYTFAQNLASKSGDPQLQSLENELASLYQQHPCLKDDTQTEKRIQKRIKLLHDYNEIKDAGQVLLGRLAHLEGCTTKAMYEQFNLALDE